jgi:hypothetical protein
MGDSIKAQSEMLDGAKRNHLFICATSSLYSILVSVTGARYPR